MADHPAPQPSPAQPLLDATALFMATLGPIGQRLFPGGRFGHPCVRTVSQEQQEAVRHAMTGFGNIHVSAPNGRPIYWVELDRPLSGGGIESKWLEITGPKANPATGEPYPLGPQMLVFIDKTQLTPVVQPVFGSPTYMLRCQNISAEEILGLV